MECTGRTVVNIKGLRPASFLFAIANATRLYSDGSISTNLDRFQLPPASGLGAARSLLLGHGVNNLKIPPVSGFMKPVTLSCGPLPGGLGAQFSEAPNSPRFDVSRSIRQQHGITISTRGAQPGIFAIDVIARSRGEKKVFHLVTREEVFVIA